MPQALSARLSWKVLRFFLTGLAIGTMTLWAQEKPKPPKALSFAKQPINFEPNRGQVKPPASFVVRAPNLNVALRPLGLDLRVGGATSGRGTIGVTFLGGDSAAEVTASDLRASYSNYIFGNDPSRWIGHVPNFGRVKYKNIYRGIDVVFYGTGERLEHDFIVAPGADYHLIRVRLEGTKRLEVGDDGNLKLALDDGDLTFVKPEVYQERAERKVFLQARYVLLGKDEFGFEVEAYDRSQPLVIDPILTYSTYLANAAVDITGLTTDAEGNTFVTGLTFSSGFPVTTGAPCNSCPNDADVFVTKMNATGTALVYSTLIGGSSYNQSAGIAVDKNGNAVVAGYTASTDFPVKNPIMTVTSGTGAQYAFITSLSPDGSTLNYSSVMGDGSSMSSAGGVALDASGNAYIAGQTNSAVFPYTKLKMVTPGSGNTVGFVTMFLPTGSLGYGAILGATTPQNPGNGLDGIEGIAVDTAGSAYITGSSGSLWPTTPGAYQTSIPGTAPYSGPFVTKLAVDGSSLVYSTFLSNGGAPTGIKVNLSGNAFVTGDYAPNGFPTTSNAYQGTLSPNACCVSFVTEFDPTGSTLVYSTCFGGGSISTSQGTTSTTGIALDGNENVWLSGGTSDPQFPLKYPLQSIPATNDGAPTLTGFVSELAITPTNTQLLFSSYWGGQTGGSISRVAIDGNQRAHVAGTTLGGLYTTPGAYLSSVSTPPPDVEYTYPYLAVIDTSVASPSTCFSPQGLNFGFVRTGTSQNQTVTVTNCGNASLTISSIASSNSIFTIPTSSNGCSQAVATNSSCSFVVTLTPTAVAAATATLTIASNAPISSVELIASGIGAVPIIQASNANVTFDPQFIGQTSPSQILLVSNGARVPLHIDLTHTTVSPGFAYTQTGCDGLLGSCVFSLTFTPSAAGLTTGALNIASDDPVTPILTIGLSGTGYSSYPAPMLASVIPPTVPLGSTSITLQISGTNFFPASVVYAAGLPQVTTYQDSTFLTATLNSSLLGSLGEIPITVFNPAPGGAESVPFVATAYQSIPLGGVALVHDPGRNLLYAAIRADAANNPNTVAVVNPETATVKQYIAVGNDPAKLALSSDGNYLYVALNGDHAIQRINMSSLTVDQTFALPVDSSFGLLTAADMKVVPGSPLSVVVALFCIASPAEDGIALYSNATLVNWLPSVTQNVVVDNFDFAGSPPVVYSIPGEFGVFTIDSTGIHMQSTAALGQGPSGPIVSDGTLLYLSGGQVWNPSPLTLLGTATPPPSEGVSVVPDASVGRTFYLDQFASYALYGATAIEAYDQSSFGLLGTVPFVSPAIFGPDAATLVRWGTNGFAFLVDSFVATPGSDTLILLRSSISGAATGQNPEPVLASLSTTSATLGGPGFTLSVTGSSFVNGAVVQWNGGARTTTFVSATQLSANITAADIAQAGTELIAVSNPAPGGGLSSPLSFTVIAAAPAASLSNASLTFVSQTVGTTSATQTVTLTNTGGLPLTIGAAQVTEDFAESNNCPSTLASLAICTFSVTFTPTATGARVGSLAITDGAANSPQTVALSGTGAADFSFGASGSNNTTATVSAGQTATYSLSIVSSANSSGTVTLTCTQVPVNAHCAVNPPSLSLTSGQSASFSVTVTTGSTSAGLIISSRVVWAFCALGWLIALPLAKGRPGTKVLGARQIFGRALAVIATLCLFIAAGVAGCGGGPSSPPPVSLTTMPGTYTLQIVATEGATSQSQSITLVVQ